VYSVVIHVQCSLVTTNVVK